MLFSQSQIFYFNKQDPSKLDTEHHKTVAELESDEHITSFTVSDLYLFMGREVETMDEIPAGNILGQYSISHI